MGNWASMYATGIGASSSSNTTLPKSISSVSSGVLAPLPPPLSDAKSSGSFKPSVDFKASVDFGSILTPSFDAAISHVMSEDLHHLFLLFHYQTRRTYPLPFSPWLKRTRLKKRSEKRLKRLNVLKITKFLNKGVSVNPLLKNMSLPATMTFCWDEVVVLIIIRATKPIVIKLAKFEITIDLQKKMLKQTCH